MRQTYDEAMQRVYQDEGGYSNDPGDAGGPTNYGITIHDARTYWKPTATAADVRNMPKSVAADIYRKHYADTIGYDQLPPGVDYAVLDYAINSGVGRATPVYKKVAGQYSSPVDQINAIYDEREAFLRAIAKRPSQAKFLRGWLSRTGRGRALALSLYNKYKTQPPTNHTVASAIVVSGTATAAVTPHNYWPWIVAGSVAAIIVSYLLFRLFERKANA